MSENEEHAQASLEELLTKESQLKKKGILSALGIGILAGVMIYGLVKNGFGFLYIAIPGVLIYGVLKGSQKHRIDLQQVRAEIKLRQAN